VKWLRKAADQGNANAQAMLGGAYADGRGVLRDYAEAMKWLRKAADQGNANVQYLLGHMLFFGGRGVPPDYTEAAKELSKNNIYNHFIDSNIWRYRVIPITVKFVT
jgi:hypothetical protein